MRSIRARAGVLAFSLAAGWAGLAQAGPAWVGRTSNGKPVASISLAGGVGVVVLCDPGQPSYSFVVGGPANGLRAGEEVMGEVRGRKTVKLRFWRVEVDPKGRATLTTSGGARGSLGDQSGALYALEAIRTAQTPIVIRSGGFSVAIPQTGAEAAFAPLVARCGALKPMADRAWHREYGG